MNRRSSDPMIRVPSLGAWARGPGPGESRRPPVFNDAHPHAHSGVFENFAFVAHHEDAHLIKST